MDMTSGGSRGGARGARPPPLILGKKEEMTEGKMAAMVSKSRPPPPPPPLAQGLDPPLMTALTLHLPAGLLPSPTSDPSIPTAPIHRFLYFRRFDGRKCNAHLPFDTEKHLTPRTKG